MTVLSAFLKGEIRDVVNTSAAEGENTAFRGRGSERDATRALVACYYGHYLLSANQPTSKSARRRHNIFTDWRRESGTCHGDDLEV